MYPRTFLLDRRMKTFSYKNVHTQQYKRVWIPLGYSAPFFCKLSCPPTDPRYYSITRNSSYDGNTVLLRLHNNKYLYISNTDAYTFVLEPDDFVVHYYSLIGKNDTPFPVIIGRSHYYFLKYRKCVHINKYRPKLTKYPDNFTDMLSIYHYFFHVMKRKHKKPLTCQAYP